MMAHKRVFGMAVFFLLAAAVAYWLLEIPRIVSLDPVSFAPGEIVSIRGRHFGASQKDKHVLFDSSPLTKSSYISWSDEEIKVRIPASADSGLLQVSTMFGTSNPEMIIASARLPARPENSSRVNVGPAIRAINPVEAAIGSLVEIEGINFGSNLQFSAVRFSRNAAGIDTVGESLDGGAANISRNSSYVEPEDPGLMYESWDDKKIAVRVPEGAGTGTIVVSTPQGQSAPFSFKVRQGSGAKYLYSPAVYSVQFRIDIKKSSKKPNESIVLYLPNPAGTLSQKLETMQEENPAPFMADFGNVAVFKLMDFLGNTAFVSRTALVSVLGVETDLGGFRDSFPDGKVPGFLQGYLIEDALVPARAKEVLALSAKIIGKEKNLQKKASLVWDWLRKNLSWKTASGPRDSVLSAIRDGKAGTRQYSLLACALLRAAAVPAVPLSGFLARKDGVSVPHFWLEYYLPAVGWIPFDPVLGLGSEPGGFDASLDNPLNYFGSLDNRHIAISRGITNVTPMLGGSDMKTDKVQWSFQTLFEESIGIAYESTWHDIDILGVY